MYKNKGFSLIELMIVVAVVAIIATIAYPSFLEHQRKARRTDCQNALMEIAAQQERFHDEFGRYTTNIGGSFAAGTGLELTAQSSEGFYALTTPQVGGGNNQTYLATCSPVVGGPQDGDRCGNLTLNHIGEKATSNPSADLKQCW